MSKSEENINAEVISVFPDRIKVKVDDLNDFKQSESLKVGSYLKVSDNDNAKLMAIIENFSIEVDDVGNRNYIIEAYPLGMIIDGKFERGGDSIAIPPKKVEPATKQEINQIYTESLEESRKFDFSKLSTNPEVRVPVDGNKFFNKHIAVVGSTGSGKSHTLSTIIHKAINQKNGKFHLNNSHIVLFDIHSEYKELNFRT
jgi:DNA helicase HerA-like ATPase